MAEKQPTDYRGTSLLDAFRGRLRGRKDSEHEQALVRIVIASLVLAYMGHVHVPGPEAQGHEQVALIWGVGAFLAFSTFLFGAIVLSPAINVHRRVLGMVMDAAMTTYCVALSGEVGVAIFGVYLFIIFGNGFRYGRAYLLGCQAMCLAGFLYVLLTSPFWESRAVSGWGLLVALIVLPLYVLTLLKRIEESRAKAEEANRAKSEFLANMSHEMRTPLNGIVGLADLLKTTSLDKDQRDLVQLLKHSVASLRALVDDVLDISKIEAGRLTIEVVDFDLHASLNSVINMMRPHAASKKLGLRAMIDPAIDYQVKGDPHHLRQVLVNLLSNAIKFTEEGHIEVVAGLVSETSAELRIRFDVRDTGIGIPIEAQKTIFERFVQADTSTTRRYGGTGLGTTIAKDLVELMGGSIGLESTPGVGSVFWFDIPLQRVHPPAEARSSESAANHLGAPTLLVAEADYAAKLGPLVDAACGDVRTFSASSVVGQVKRLRDEGLVVPAVLVAGNAETACQVFEQVAAEQCGAPTAMIYIASAPPTTAERQRLRAIDGASFLGIDASPRLLRNAIHAATSTDQRESAEVIDLGLSLKQNRTQLRVLVAEDNATNQAIIRRLLENAGHDVLVVSDGEEALDAFEDWNPDLAIFDFNMPLRNGLEATSAIRNMELSGSRLPIVILSASVRAETRAKAIQAGADEFVGKPFDATALLQVVDGLSNGQCRRGSLEERVNKPTPANFASISRIPSSKIPLVNEERFQEVQQIGAASPNFIHSLVEGFGSDIEGLLGRLDAAVAANQTVTVTDITHAIKGAAVGIGAQQLAARCGEVDHFAVGVENDGLQASLVDLRKCFSATMRELRPHLPESRATTN
jgi:two-component system sensor histidine kinase RpfC